MELSLSLDELNIIISIMNTIQGMENAKILLPIYTKLVEAVKTFEAKPLSEEIS